MTKSKTESSIKKEYKSYIKRDDEKLGDIHKDKNKDNKEIIKTRFINKEIEISIEELCMTLDFFHNGCNAVFENPKDKNKPLVFKYKKNLLKYDLPKGRSLNKITIKQKVKYIL